MLIVAERINASRTPIRAALEKLDTIVIQAEAKSQAAAGAHYIDVNGGTFPGREPELLCWLVETVQAVTDLPLCIDSPDPVALSAALRKVKSGRPMINSISLEGERFDHVLPLALEYRARLIALCQGEAVPAATAAQKIDLATQLVGRLTRAGLAIEDIYVDPLVFPLATESSSANASLDAIGEIMRRFPGVHTICGLSNVSHGLPVRKLINRTLLVGAIGRGMDAAIIDPTDMQLMQALLAAEAVFGRDEYCMNYIGAYQDGKLA